MKTNTETHRARLRLPGTAALATTSHDTRNVMSPASPLRRALTCLALAAAVLGLGDLVSRAQAAPIDLSSATGVMLADTAAGGDGTLANTSWPTSNSYSSTTGYPWSNLTDGDWGDYGATKWLGAGTDGWGAYPGTAGPGKGAGFYFTLPAAANMQTIQFFTEDSSSNRSPATMTIEGSNATGGDLMTGTNWTPLYSGTAGLATTPDNSAGETVSFTNATAYTSYRVLFPTTLGAAPGGVQLADIVATTGVAVGTETSTTALANPNTNPSTYGDSLSFDVTVSGGFGIPTGTVTLKAGTTTLGSETLISSGPDGVCTITTTTLAVTHDPIVAVYGGDTIYAGSTSGTLSPDQTVNPASSTVTVTGATSFTYTGTPQGPDTSTTSGSSGAVTYQYDGTGGTTYGPASTRPTDVGTYTCTATLAADANYASAVSAAFAFEIIVGSPPANDNFVAAIDLTPASGGTQTGTDNVDASVEAGEPNSENYHTVWFQWTAPADGFFFISTLGSTDPGFNEWDAVLAIYTGSSVNALTTVAGPQDIFADETINGLPVTSGTTYYIQLAGYGNGLASNIVLNWAYSSTASAVTYDANTATGGTAPADTTSYVSGTTVTVQGNTDLVKTGYTFDGWNTQADGLGDPYAPAATFPITANTTLYAQWAALPTYTVTYNGNGSDNDLDAPVDPSSPYASGTTVTVLGQGALVKTGLAFDGWNTQADGLGTSYLPADTFSITADTTLYAQWALPPTPVTVTAADSYPLNLSQGAGWGNPPADGISATDLMDVSQSGITLSSISVAATSQWGSDSALNDHAIWPTVGYYNGSGVITVTFDTTVNTAGYDISSIISYSANQDPVDRISQKYDVEYHTVGGGWVGLAGDSGATVDRLFTGSHANNGSDIGGTMAVTISCPGLTGVDQLRFTTYTNSCASPAEFTFTEIDVIGTATASGTTYAGWATTNGASNNPNEDTNNDGVQNGIAYFMDATGIATHPGITGNTVTWPNGGNIANSEYGTQFVVQTSPDLVNWTPVGAGDPNLSNTAGSVSYTLPTGAGKLFARLVVTPN